MTGPCEWPITYGGAALPSGYPEPGTPERKLYEEMAAEYLWRWTGRRLGRCEVTLRPCRDDWSGSTFFGGPSRPLGNGAPWTPAMIDGRWHNVVCGWCGSSCRCDGPNVVELPGPVSAVLEVLIDGQLLSEDAYHRTGRQLVRTDGGRWPIGQDLSEPATETGTWQITYLRGLDVPAGGQLAAGLFAIELFKAARRDASCQLPKRVQSIAREGVTVAMAIDSFEDVDAGRTGIWLVDSWVASLMKPPTKPGVLSPDYRPQRTSRRTR